MIRIFPLLVLACLVAASPAAAADRPPNFVLIYCDDLGYADIDSFGTHEWQTPNLNQMAKEGLRLTDFHTAAAVCSASRAALMTGCYPQRVGILGALGPNAKTGINESEMLLPEILRERGYATAIFGKWHLGDAPQFLPTRHGFDQYFGLPYSNDMWPKHPTNTKFPPLPLIEQEKTIATMPDQTQLTTWYTEHAVKFIAQNKAKPFFLYLPHSMPHVPLHVSEKFKGKSKQGLYGDVIMEIDWSVGEILKTLRQHKLDDNTLVIFTSDNGPWLSYGNHAGSAGPLREGKGTHWEGGTRVPCVMRWPGKIPAGTTSGDILMTIDLFPTIAKLIGAELPKHKIDGLDVWPLIIGTPGAKNPHNGYYGYYE
ncbi:MAG: sulfatase, partial [Pirellulaceae bacterium]|nr:sulfatase [Pirellulaceae bacterium]